MSRQEKRVETRNKADIGNEKSGAKGPVDHSYNKWQEKQNHLTWQFCNFKFCSTKFYKVPVRVGKKKGWEQEAKQILEMKNLAPKAQLIIVTTNGKKSKTI